MNQLMIIKNLNPYLIFIMIGVIFYILIYFFIEIEPINFLNLLSSIFFFGLLILAKNVNLYKVLFALIYFISSLIYLYIYTSYFYAHGFGFIADAKDTIFYHDWAIRFLEYGLVEGIIQFLSSQKFYDLGAVIYTYLIYTIAPEPFIVYIFNFIFIYFSISIFSKLSILIFKFKSRVNLLFKVLLIPLFFPFAVTHFKEALLVFVFSLFCYSLYAVFCSRSFSSFLLLFISGFALLFLRPIIIVFPIIALVLTLFHEFVSSLRRARFKISHLFLFLVCILSAVLMFDIFLLYARRFAFFNNSSDFYFTAISIVLSFIGPFSKIFSVPDNVIGGMTAFGVYILSILSIQYVIGLGYLIYAGDIRLRFISYFLIIHSFLLGWIGRGFDPRFFIYLQPFILMVSFFMIYKIGNFIGLKQSFSVNATFAFIISAIFVTYQLADSSFV